MTMHSSPPNPKRAFCLPGFRRSLLHLDTSVSPLQKAKEKKSFSETSETICSFDALWVFPSLMRLRHGSSVFDDKLLDKRHIWPLVRYVNVIRPSITLSYTYSCMPRWLLFFFLLSRWSWLVGILMLKVEAPLWNCKQNHSLLFDFY